MSSPQGKVKDLASRIVQSNHDDEDDNAIFAELEAEIENNDDSEVRERGYAYLRKEMEKVKEMQESAHGRYVEIANEKEVIQISAREPRCVIHFYHSNFRRCEIMDRHLAKIAPKYFNTRFIRVFVENVPFLVERLGIKVLPCVMCFIDGVSKDRLVGFEELGNVDAFETAALELRLSNCGVLKKANQLESSITYNVSSPSGQNRFQTTQDDDDFDMD